MVTGISIFAVMAMTGLAIDLGRMYVAKNETQTYVDSASLAAALELNGDMTGFQDARDAVTTSANCWNFGHDTFANTQTEFSQNATGPWEANPGTAANYRFAKVTASVPVPMTFIRSVAQGDTRPVNATAVAGQVLKVNVPEGGCPFSPFARPGSTAPDWGLSSGTEYTLRWGSSPSLKKPKTLCVGDTSQEMIDLVEAGSPSQRGYIEDESASLIRKSVVYGYQTTPRAIGDSVVMTDGTMQTVGSALTERVTNDSDSTSATFTEYFNNIETGATNAGNGSRLMSCPVNTGFPNYTIVAYLTFYLLPEANYSVTLPATAPFCAEYVGKSYVQGSDTPGAGDSGFYVVRLVQ